MVVPVELGSRLLVCISFTVLNNSKCIALLNEVNLIRESGRKSHTFHC